MAYTPAPNKTKTPGIASNFSNLQNDGSRNALTGIVGNRIQTQDGAVSPHVSPQSLNGLLVLTVPQNAAQITVSSQTNPVNVSEDSTATQYFTQPAGTAQTYDVANQESITLDTATTTTVSFYFSMI